MFELRIAAEINFFQTNYIIVLLVQGIAIEYPATLNYHLL
jgi:hypothetical protein